MDEFIKFWAMECLLNHIDGYSNNNNNTYMYDDRNLSKSASVNPNFKFIHSGLDQLFRDDLPEVIDREIFKNKGIAKLLATDSKYLNQVKIQIQKLKDGVFSDESLKKDILPYLDLLTEQANKINKTIDPESKLDSTPLKRYLTGIKNTVWS